RIADLDARQLRLFEITFDAQGVGIDSIATGIEDRERTAGTGLLANINPTFSWVRLAQSVPVSINLDNVPGNVHLIAGL
ncbi:efflux transporter periplasmic adaptor subunit, partial [Rhizobium ruizarguesonis]